MILVLAIITIFLTVILSFLAYKWFSLQRYNQKPLSIKTFDGSESPYHPSVLYFSKGWNGWRYWMAETPFSPNCIPYRDRNECPSIHVSNDGVNWRDLPTLVNPLVDLTKENIKNLDYYSDPHLVVVGNSIQCYFRLTCRHGKYYNFDNVEIFRLKSDDGIKWIKEVISVIDSPVVSPSLIYKEAVGYIMWFVDSESHTRHRNVRLSFSDDGVEWSKSEICLLKGESVNPWHIDVQLIDDYYYLTVYDFCKLTLWRAPLSNPNLFDFVQTLLTPAFKKFGSFYSNGLYRACLVRTEYGIELFFSADDSKRTSIGRMVSKMESIDHRGPWNFEFATECGLHSDFKDFICDTIDGYKRWLFFIVKNMLSRLFR